MVLIYRSLRIDDISIIIFASVVEVFENNNVRRIRRNLAYFQKKVTNQSVILLWAELYTRIKKIHAHPGDITSLGWKDECSVEYFGFKLRCSNPSCILRDIPCFVHQACNKQLKTWIWLRNHRIKGFVHRACNKQLQTWIWLRNP